MNYRCPTDLYWLLARRYYFFDDAKVEWKFP